MINIYVICVHIKSESVSLFIVYINIYGNSKAVEVHVTCVIHELLSFRFTILTTKKGCYHVRTIKYIIH